jgi:hypothetical protein
MAKLTLNDIVSGYGTAALYNANNALLEAAVENTLSRDGTAPNTMGADLDMNTHDINNVGTINCDLILQDGQPIAANAVAVAAAQAALVSETNAAASAAAALLSEANALASELAAAASAAAALISEGNASSSETAAGASATAASGSASAADASAIAAAASESAASLSEGNAATSEFNAAASESAASASASAALASEGAAAASETAAGISAGNAATSETNAGLSAAAASTSEGNAATSESNASASAGAASTSAGNAATSETNAAASAGAASTSAGNAATSESNAAASEVATALVYDNFDDRYLGAKAVAPTLDNDGDALIVGALYFDSVLAGMYAWNGSSWSATAGGGGSAASTTFTPYGGISSTNVQAGMQELDDEKATSASPTFTGTAVINADLNFENTKPVKYKNASGSISAGTAGTWEAKWSDNNYYIDNYEGTTYWRGASYTTLMSLPQTGILTTLGLSTVGNVYCNDVYATRVASPTTGVIFLGNSGSRYLYFDGSSYSMPTSNLYVAGALAIRQGAGEAGQSTLKTTYGESAFGGSGSNITLPGGQYGFYPQWKNTSTYTTMSIHIFVGMIYSSSYLTSMYASYDGGTVYGLQRYVQASPPYDLGDGEIPLFIFALVDKNGKVQGAYVAPEAPWHYNGPTNITANRYDTNGKSYKKVSKFAAEHGSIKQAKANGLDMDSILTALEDTTEVEIEITQAIKNADMDLIPQPFSNYNPDYTVVMLDPVSPLVQKLAMLHHANESVCELLIDEDLKVTNNQVVRKGPQGLLIVESKWKKTK